MSSKYSALCLGNPSLTGLRTPISTSFRTRNRSEKYFRVRSLRGSHSESRSKRSCNRPPRIAASTLCAIHVRSGPSRLDTLAPCAPPIIVTVDSSPRSRAGRSRRFSSGAAVDRRCPRPKLNSLSDLRLSYLGPPILISDPPAFIFLFGIVSSFQKRVSRFCSAGKVSPCVPVLSSIGYLPETANAVRVRWFPRVTALRPPSRVSLTRSPERRSFPSSSRDWASFASARGWRFFCSSIYRFCICL